MWGELCIITLPPIFRTFLYSYALRYIIYLGEPKGNIISNYNGKILHIIIHGYYAIYQTKLSKPSFFLIHKRKSELKNRHFFNSSPKLHNFDTIYDTGSKIFSPQNIKNLLVCWKIAKDSPVSGRNCLIGQTFFSKYLCLIPTLKQEVKE